jgi:hypothetical protein
VQADIPALLLIAQRTFRRLLCETVYRTVGSREPKKLSVSCKRCDHGSILETLLSTQSVPEVNVLRVEAMQSNGEKLSLFPVTYVGRRIWNPNPPCPEKLKEVSCRSPFEEIKPTS